MATLVLTAVGSLLGPVGAAIGALAGQAVDAQLFKPKGRQGPRLQDLKVQTSSYGSQIPKLFGTMRVAGTVIWSTDLIEQRSKSGGGKGRPSTTTYSYSASFAVALSARPIRSVGRIWADGNLLRGAAGDWKSQTGFQLHLGGEDQAADPFIASAEGSEETPAYRGCAYAVFENMALGPFGNRIPSLTFEVEADAGAVTTGAMLDMLSEGLIRGGGGHELLGFAASGNALGAVVESLEQALPLQLRDDGEALTLAVPALPVALVESELSEQGSESLRSADRAPAMLAVSHYDPARDYQAGVQHARRPGGGRTLQVDLPAVLQASEARQVAEAKLAQLASEAVRRTVRCGWARLTCVPGTTVMLPDSSNLWRVQVRTVDRGGVQLELARFGLMAADIGSAEPGRHQPAPDQVHGPTVLHVLDLPNLEETAPAQPRLYAVAAGAEPGWRRAALMVSLDAGESWTALGGTAAPAVIGTASTVLAGSGPAVFDRHSTVTVQLLHSGMMLEDANDARLIAGVNLALLGNELIQFGRAEPIGGSAWRLSNLLRGRRGSGWAAGEHEAGERFVLIEPEALFAYHPSLSVAGGEVRMLASGVGDAHPVQAVASAVGEALRPPAPVHLTARRRADGGFDVAWNRSSRCGWAWVDGADAPLSEDSEGYRLTITPLDGISRTYDLSTPSFVYSAGDVAADLASGEPVTLSVVQIGTSALSRPVQAIIV
jgi:hypothetical protein